MFQLREAKSICPEVLSKIPTSKSKKQTTARACVGLNQLAQAGFAIFCPWDFKIVIDWQNGHKAEIEEGYDPPVWPEVIFHTDQQTSPYLNNKCIAKITLPVTGYDKSGAKYMLHGATMHNSKIGIDYDVPTGIMDFKHSESMHVFVAISGNDGDVVKFKAGEILAQLIPLSTEMPEIEHVAGDARFWSRVNFFGSDVRNRYYNIRNHFSRIGE